VDGFGSVGPRHARARLAHKRSERWVRELVRDVRAARRQPPAGSALGARVERPFVWRGHRFPEGRLVLLDVYGTDHDPKVWPDPDVFDPGRFLGVEPGRFAFVPHGGGDPATGHRCAGERVAVELLKGAVRVLAGLTYQLPDQHLRYPLHRMPTRLRSGFVITNVRPA
jgi:fatty-acid peroxygenase